MGLHPVDGVRGTAAGLVGGGVGEAQRETPATRRSGGPVQRVQWAWAGVLLVVLLAVLDLTEAGPAIYTGLMVVGPFLAAMGVGAVRTGLVAGYTVLVVALLLDVEGIAFGSVGHLTRALAVGAGSALAVWVSAQRVHREASLLRIQAVAEAAQRAILRSVPARVGQTAFAARYQSASEESRIGGDMYEVADSPHGVRVLIGDVRGKGLGAVQLTSLVLGSFREAAFLYEDLVDVAQGMADSTARNVSLEDFVTVVLLELKDDQITVVNCGHLAPIRMPVEGGFHELDAPITTPLGLSPQPEAARLSWSVGDRLLLYTDGLAEARDRNGVFFPLEAAIRICGERATSISRCLDDVLAAVARHVGGRLSDDLAVVLVERLPDTA